MHRLESHPTPFAVTAADESWLLVSGEVDMATAPLLEHAVRDAERARPDRLTIDLSGVGFLDVSGLRVLLLAARRAREDGRRVVLARPTRMIRRLLALTAIDQSVEVLKEYDSPPPVAGRLPEAG
jgi:anti-sigma B factor antagonist